MLTTEEIHKRIEELALPILANAGVDLVDLHIGRHKSGVLVQFSADKPGGGITIEECAHLNRALVEEIDRQGFLGDDYALEFSSPGLDRPLRTAKDFQRNLNAEVQVWLSAPVEGKREWAGVLQAATAQSIGILVKKNQHIEIPLAHVIKGILVI